MIDLLLLSREDIHDILYFLNITKTGILVLRQNPKKIETQHSYEKINASYIHLTKSVFK